MHILPLASSTELPLIHVDSTFPQIRTDRTKLQYMFATNFAIETVFNEEFYQFLQIKSLARMFHARRPFSSYFANGS